MTEYWARTLTFPYLSFSQFGISHRKRESRFRQNHEKKKKKRKIKNIRVGMSP